MSDLYHILGLKSAATEAEIRNAYKKLARVHHPDKRVSMVMPNQAANPQNESTDEMFSTITRAYEILSDPVKRASYNLTLGLGNLESVLELQRKDAERANQLMAVAFDQRRKSELSCGGLVVDDAWYGASEAVLQPEKHATQVINVTRQLQCMVDGSKLVIAKGDAKSHLTGLWDPCPGNSEKALRVNYFFKGKLHQTMVRDDEMLLAPVKAHLVQPPSNNSSKKPISKSESSSSSSSAKSSSAPSPNHKQTTTSRLFLFAAIPFVGIVTVIMAKALSAARN